MGYVSASLRRRAAIGAAALACALTLGSIPHVGATPYGGGGGSGGSENSVQAQPNNTFSPNDVSIDAGEKVTFTNSGGFHNVAWDDGAKPPIRRRRARRPGRRSAPSPSRASTASTASSTADRAASGWRASCA